MNKARLALLALVLVGAHQALFLSAGAQAEPRPEIRLQQAEPTPSTDPSATPSPDPTEPSPDPTPTEPSPTGTSPSSEPTPSPSTSASSTPKAGAGKSAKPSPSASPGETAGALEGCGGSGSNAGSGGYLYAPNPPYVVPEPAGMYGPQSTHRVKSILAAWRGPGRVSLDRAFREVAGPFPVAGVARWSNDWHAYRACPYPHLHKGLDIVAAWGTPVVAAADGVVTQIVNNSISGLAVEIRDRSGIEYFYAHLSSYAPGLRVGEVVKQGRPLGRVGTTGNAVGSTPHLHFEIQPGGQSMPPKPVVDRWLLGMEKRARVLVKEGKEALTAQKSTDATTLMGLLGDAAPPAAAAASLRSPEPVESFPVVLGAAFAAILLMGLGLETLRFTGRRRRSAGPEALPTAVVRERETLVSLLGVGVVVVPTVTALATEGAGPVDG